MGRSVINELGRFNRTPWANTYSNCFWVVRHESCHSF
nr:MAG TPA: hypothetical protein [Caudoviricetes sp.]